MAASVGRYQASLSIPEFKGLLQQDESGGMNVDMRYAADGENFDTRDGDLMPSFNAVEFPVQAEFNVRSATLFNRRWSSTGADSGNKALIIACGDGKVYRKKASINATSASTGAGSWTQITMPTGVTSFQSNYWSFVTYEYTPEGASAPVDILLMSNAKDGMFMLRGDTFAMTAVTTPKKFGVIERHADRLWGGGIPTDPDMLMYSAPFDPMDWDQNEEIPEDGAGDIRVPSFDGEGFTALRTFGGSLLAFKKSNIWRITGTNPAEYVITEQYGGGTIFPNTIATDQERMFFLTEKGVCMYDGLRVAPFQQNALRNVWRDSDMIDFIATSNETLTNPTNFKLPYGILWKDRYIVLFPYRSDRTDTDTLKYNSMVVSYDFSNQNWALHKVRANSSGPQGPTGAVFAAPAITFLGQDTNGLMLLTNAYGSTAHAKLEVWWPSPIDIPSWFRFQNLSIDVHIQETEVFNWVSPWTDMGAKNVLKQDFQLRLFTHASLNSMISAKKIKLEVTIETERGRKSREILCEYHDSQQREIDGEHLLRFHISGRRVRIIIRQLDYYWADIYSSWFRIKGGVLLTADTTPD